MADVLQEVLAAGQMSGLGQLDPGACERTLGAIAERQPEKMAQRPLGDSGLMVSVISLGCFAFGGDKQTGSHLGKGMAALHAQCWGKQADEDSIATVKAALDAGLSQPQHALHPAASVSIPGSRSAAPRSAHARPLCALRRHQFVRQCRDVWRRAR